MKKLMILAIICIPILFTGCEKRIIDTSVTIYGGVYDATTKNPIKGAFISILGAQGSSYTGSNGSYSFEVDLDPGKYTIQAHATGYRADWREIKVTAGAREQVSFELIKE